MSNLPARKSPILFSFENYSIRVVTDEDNRPWFVAKDVCEQLDVKNVSDALSRLDSDEKDEVVLTDTIGKRQGMAIVSESGFYSLVLSSRKPEAKAFKKWVTSEVLPSIREDGYYSMQKQLPSNYLEALQALVASETEKEELRLISAGQASQIEHQTEVIKQKDQYVIASNEASIKAGEILVREFCKSVDIVDIGEKHFYQWMRDKGIVSENNEPYSQFVKAGYFTYKPTEEIHGGKYRYTMRITPRGKVWLAR